MARTKKPRDDGPVAEKPAEEKAKAPQSLLSLFLVRQDIDHMKGDYFAQALVATIDAKRAVKLVLDDVESINAAQENEETPKEYLIDKSRLRADRLGPVELPKLPKHGDNMSDYFVAGVVMMSFGKDYDC